MDPPEKDDGTRTYETYEAEQLKKAKGLAVVLLLCAIGTLVLCLLSACVILRISAPAL